MSSEPIPNFAGGSSGFAEGQIPPAGERCRFLRHKKMYYDFDRESALAVGPECGGTPFWCVKTSRPVGPDSAPALPEDCRKERRCFEA